MKRAVVLLALGACIEIPGPTGPPCEPGEDLDTDGWTCDGIVPDCDDRSRTINPGALDEIGDGIDGDCIGGDRTADDELAAATIDEGGAVARTRDLVVRFPDVGAGLPTSIRERSTDLELLALRGLGVAATPGPDTGVDAIGFRSVEAEGPAVVEIVVDWTVGSNDPSAVLSGNSRFRFLPDDRILRDDFVALDTALPAPGPYDLGAFAVFSPERYNRVDWHSNPVAEPLAFEDAGATPYLGGAGEPGWACFVHASAIREMGVVWLDTGPAGARVAVAPEGLTVGYDWERAATSIAGDTWFMNMMLVSGPADFGACGGTIGRAEDLLSPAPLVATANGGVVFDFDPETGEYLVQANQTYAEVRVQNAPIHPGLLLEVHFDVEPIDGVTVWHDRIRMERGVDFHVQPVPETIDGVGVVMVWLATPLEDGDVIRVALPGGEEPGE